jgi:ketosteroid isomerase-like protein
MTHDITELVRRGIADVNVFWELLDDYVVWDLRAWPLLPDLDSVYVGRDAVIKASSRYWGTWTDYEVVAEEILPAGSCVVVMVHERGRGKGSGVPFDVINPQVWTFRDGRIVRWESLPSRAHALEVVGFAE